MKDVFEKTLLFDFYGELLTDKQKQIYSLYHLDDLSLGEISEQMNISRQGVFDTLKRCNYQLNNFEEKLQLVQKFINNKKRADEICQLILCIKKKMSEQDLVYMDEINKIEEISKSIIEDL